MSNETSSSYQDGSDSVQMSDTYTEKSSSSEKHSPFQYDKQVQMNLQFKNEILANEENYQSMNGKQQDMYNDIVIKNERLIQRLVLFNKTNYEELPTGTYETRNKLIVSQLECKCCKELAFRPIVFATCSHQFCPHCIIQSLVNHKIKTQQDTIIPKLDDLLQKDRIHTLELACPLCLEKQKQDLQHIYFNQTINKIIYQYYRSTPVDEPIISMEDKCILCNKSEEKRVSQKQKDEDVIKQTISQLSHFCCYCGRHICNKCRKKDPYREHLTHAFLRKLSEITSEEIELLFGESKLISSMNEAEIDFLLSQFTLKQIWERFSEQLKAEYVLPIRLQPGSERCVDADSTICGRCIYLAVNIACHYIRSSLDNGKPLCLCGSGCFLQFTDENHQKDVQHRGKGTRGDQFWFNVFY